MNLRTGATLQGGKYLLNQALSLEGTGATFLATQTLLNQGVVIKTLDPSLQVVRTFPQMKERFIADARLLARLQHPSLPRILDFFQEEGLPFLVMEYIPGRNLQAWVSREQPLREAEAIHYIRQIGSVLHLAHQSGLVHHNLQPRSILRRHGTNLGVLVGFELAHDLVSVATAQIKPNPFTPPWTPTSATAIDRYGLAVTLFYLLSGQTTIPVSLAGYPWSPTTQDAILQGISQTTQTQSIEEWLRLLPNTTMPLVDMNATATKLQSSGQTAAPSPPQPRSPQSPPRSASARPSKSRPPARSVAEQSIQGTMDMLPSQPAPQPPVVPPTVKPIHPAIRQPAATQVVVLPPSSGQGMKKMLFITLAMTAAMGIGSGLALRFRAAQSTGASVFHPAQTFAEQNWKGTLSPSVDPSEMPLEKKPGDYNSKPAKPMSGAIADPITDPVLKASPTSPSDKVPIVEKAQPIEPIEEVPTEVRPIDESVNPRSRQPVIPPPEPIDTAPIPADPAPDVPPAPVKPRVAPIPKSDPLPPVPAAPPRVRRDAAPEPPPL